MIVTTDAPNKRVLLTFTDTEWDVLVWARNRHGPEVVKEGFRASLRQWWRQREDERLQTLANTMPTNLGD